MKTLQIRKTGRILASTCASLALLAAVAAPARSDDKKKRPDEVPLPPLKSWNAPDAKKVTLKNGVTLFVLEDHDLPLVEIRCQLRAGSLWDPEDKVGLASMAGAVWRTGGTKTHPAEELDKLVESHGISLECHVGHDSGAINLSVLKDDVDLGIQLLKELLTEPTFDEAKLEQAKRQTLSGIKRRNDTAPPIAARVFNMTVFGKTSVSAREIDARSIKAITRADLVAWHAKFVRPQNFLVGATGDLPTDALVQKVESAMGGLLAGDGWKPEMPLVDVARKASWTVIPKDVDQSAIVIGHAGGVRTPKGMDDYAKLIVMNEILGSGGFTSRLMLVVRTDLGLAYDVHSQLGLDYDRPGTFELVCQTKTESTAKAIEAMLHEVDKLRTELCSEDELAVAKESILNQVPFWIDTMEKIVDRSLNYEYHGFPQDTLKRFLESLGKVTREDVLAAAKAYIHPEAFTTVVCGDAEHFDKKIETLAKDGKVETISDPEEWAHPGAAKAAKEKPKADKPAKADEKPAAKGDEKPAAKPEGDKPAAKGDEKPAAKGDGAAKGGDEKAAAELLGKVLESVGGKKALDALAGIHMKQKVVVNAEGQTQTIKIDYVVVFPDKAHVELAFGPQKVQQILDGKNGWVVVPGRGTQKLPPAQVAQLREQIDASLVSMLKAASTGEAKAELEGDADLYGKPATKLTLRKGKAATTFFVDPKTGALLGRLEENPQIGTLKFVFADNKPCGGLSLPSSQKGRKEEDGADAEPVENVTIELCEPNPKTDAKTFAAPAAAADEGDDDEDAPKDAPKDKGGKKGGKGMGEDDGE